MVNQQNCTSGVGQESNGGRRTFPHHQSCSELNEMAMTGRDSGIGHHCTDEEEEYDDEEYDDDEEEGKCEIDKEEEDMDVRWQRKRSTADIMSIENLVGPSS